MTPKAFECSISAAIREVRATDTSADDMRAINKFSLKPLNADQVAVFRMDLCNDQIDRHFSRFPHRELNKISRMVLGKPLMPRHDTANSLPVGRFFRARVADTGEGKSVQADCYIARDAGHDDIIRNIEAGVFAGTSIGFTFNHPQCSICSEDIRDCAHWPGVDVGDDGTVCHYIMNDVTDVLEGSIVYLGSQSTEFIEARAIECEGHEVLPLIGPGDTGAKRNPALAAARAAKGVKEIVKNKPEGTVWVFPEGFRNGDTITLASTEAHPDLVINGGKFGDTSSFVVKDGDGNVIAEGGIDLASKPEPDSRPIEDIRAEIEAQQQKLRDITPDIDLVK